MSWPGEDWTVGLSGHVQQKVKQLQAQNEKLTKERQQRQLQLDNTEAALHKQKQKYEEVRVELAALQRELGGVREAAEAEVRVRERVAHDLQVKTGQAHSLEGQLESSKNLVQSLTQEIKRLEAELEKLQKGNGSGDSLLFSTPCWNMSSPWDQSGGFRAEGDGKAQHVRQQLHFGEIPKPVSGGASSPFPQLPQKSPPLRRHVRQAEASTPSSLFPWEREDLWPTPKGQPAPSVASGGVVKSSDSGIEEALRNEIDGLRVRVSDLQREKLLESEHLKDVESRLAQAQRDINTKELSLTRTQDQLTRAQTRISQETDRVQTAEQKVKQLQEELKCQRQNAESSRCNAEQRRKDMEREHQRELLEQQRERQALEKQHQQEINRHNQEIQQARTLHNTLQAQHDKVCAQKQCLERDLEDLRGKLKNTETDLRESQKRETQTEAKLTESLRENENLTVSLAQVKKQERVLQEEVKRLTDELADALKLIKELQAQLAAPPQPLSVPHFGTTGDCFAPSVSLKHDRSPPYQPSTQRKRVPQTGRTREEERMKYPSGREPGEGMDSEHIGSEDSQKLIAKGAVTQQSSSLKRSDTDVDVSLTEQDTGIEDVDTDSLMSDSTISLSSKSESGIDRHFQDDTRGNVDTRDTASLKDLKKENSELRDELRDVKYELQKRLEDLESQRKAETEARTKLKQLSRKHSNQTEQQRAKALELKDTLTKLEVQLEQEKQDNTKLRETLNVFEREVEVRQEEKERDQYESTELKEVLAEMEQKERFMEEEIKRMRTELEDIQLKLKQEREERKREKEEEREKFLKEEAEGLKIAQLQEELDNLRRFGQLEEMSRENLPVAYLQLNRHLNSNNKDLVPTPDSICDSVNLHNTIICKESSEMEVIMDFGAQTKPGKTGEGQTEIEEPLAISSKTTDLEDSTVLVLEIERLRVERDRESEKTKQAQGKLEVLQKQVNTQTKHLTQAFESQSKNIENLLRELHDKECAHQKQSEELQKCQEKISLLEEVKNTREVVEFSEISTLLEPLREISRDLSCDSAISNMSICDQEMFNDDTPQDSQPSLQLPIEHSVSRNTEQTNTRDTLDKQQISTELWNPLCLNCQCPLSTNVSSQGHKHSQVGSKNAQDTENSSVSSHSQDKHSEVLNIPENSTKDDFELERLTKELQEAEVQLNVMKTQNESLGLVKEELLSVKRENEELKARLRFVDTFADKTTKQNENAENNDLNEEGFQDGTSSGQEESLGPDENSKDEEMKGMKTTAEVHSLHKQIQTLQEQIQNLSEQNRAQAEELNLWKISTKGETEDSSSPSIIQSEFEIFLPCNSNKPCAQQQGTPMQYTKDTTQHGAEDGHEQTSSHETQMRHDRSISQGPQGQVTETEMPMITENPQECGTSFVNHNDKTPAVCTSDARNTKDVLSDLHQIALMSPVCQTNRTGAGANSQEDALIDISFPSEYQTKAILFKPIKEPCENHDSQNPDLLTVHNQIKTTETFALDKHGYRRGDATDKHDHHAAKVVPSSSTNESYKGQRAESEVNIDCKRIEGEVQSVSTQTEESEEMTERAVKRPLVHISTQTDNGQLEIEEDEVEKDPVELPTSSHTIQYVTNQLLSKAFPMSDPAHLAKRIRQNRNRMSAAYDDTEYEPYGLPEVVMKGFADIPSGPACPYVLRRGLLGTEAMPLPLKEGTPQDENEDIEP